MKSYDVYYLDNNGTHSFYDRFSNELYFISQEISFNDYIIDNSEQKNFIYNNRPIYVEKIANEIHSHQRSTDNEILNAISSTIANEISNEIDLVKLIKQGIIYLHGKQPTILKEYLEYKYKTTECLKYLVANSVILEGINFPIDTIFITSTYRLNAKDLNNLIGRVNRLNHVFQSSLSRLLSKVHFVESNEYSKSNMHNKMVLLRDHTFKDFNKNPLLEKYDVEKLKLQGEALEKRRIKDNNLLELTEFLLDENEQSFENQIKQYLIENNIDDLYYNLENVITAIINNIQSITNNNDVISIIYEVFIKNLENQITDFEIERLKNEKARNYYRNYLNVVQLMSLKNKIISTLEYFTKKALESDSFLYIGNSFGEIINPSPHYQNHESLQKVYVNLFGKSRQELANIALVKIKLEEDFVSYKLKRLITFLYDFEIITRDTYLNAIYGTNNEELINLTRVGLSPNIIKILKNNDQIKNIVQDSFGNYVANTKFRLFLENQSELFKFEVSKYIL